MATYVRTQEIEHEIGAGGRFGLRVTNTDAELNAVDGRVARVRVEFEISASSDREADEILERSRFRVERGDGFLEVGEPRVSDGALGSIVRALGIGGRVEASVSAQVPADAEINYDGVSADLTAAGFTAPQAYRTVSGDLVLDRLAGDLRIRGVSSDISLRADDSVTLEVNTVSGDVSAVAPRIGDLRVVTVSGDVELEGALASDGGHRVETVSGDLRLGLAGALALEVRGLSSDVRVSLPHRSEGSRDRRRYIVGSGGAELLFSSMSGDVSVGPPRRIPSTPVAAEPPAPPAPPTPPLPPLSNEEQMAILRALEHGEIDVEEASRRLAGGGRGE